MIRGALCAQGRMLREGLPSKFDNSRGFTSGLDVGTCVIVRCSRMPEMHQCGKGNSRARRECGQDSQHRRY